MKEKEAELFRLYQASKEYENQTEEAVKKYAKRDAKNSIERKKKLKGIASIALVYSLWLLHWCHL